MAKQKYKPLPDRLTERQLINFWNKVAKRGPDECWLWLGARQPTEGRGHVGINGTNFQAPRIAYLIATGKDPGQIGVCHTCDTPACVNPRHLILGDQLFNIRDAISKGRTRYPGTINTPRGESHPKTFFTEWQVTQIRKLYAAGGTTYRKLAVRFGCDWNTIGAIVRRQTWKHLTDGILAPKRRK